MAKPSWYSKFKRDLEESIEDGALTRLGSDMPDPRSTCYKFTSPSLNWATDGGLPGGKVLLGYGPESSGKTFLFFDLVKNMQAIDPEGVACLYDAEYHWDPNYAAKIGVDIDRIIVRQTNQSSKIFDHFTDKIMPMVQDGLPLRMIGVDSVRSIRGPAEEDMDSVNDNVMADLARLLPKVTKKWIGPIRQSKIATVLVQQVNEEMDADLVKYQHKKWKVPNGQALKHFADLMVLVERVNAKDSKIFDREAKDPAAVQLGHTVRAKAEKNRVGAPYRVAEFQLQYGVGIVNTHAEVAGLAIKLGVVERPNNQTYRFGADSWRGRAAFEEAVQANPALQVNLMQQIMSVYRDPSPQDVADALETAYDFGEAGAQEAT